MPIKLSRMTKYRRQAMKKWERDTRNKVKSSKKVKQNKKRRKYKNIKLKALRKNNLEKRAAFRDFINVEDEETITELMLQNYLRSCRLYEEGNPNWRDPDVAIGDDNGEHNPPGGGGGGGGGGDDGGDDDDDDDDDENDEEDEPNGPQHVGNGDSFFNDLLKSPKKAILLYYLNSGYLRFQGWKDYDASFDGEDVDIDALKKEIRSEIPSNVELSRLVKEFACKHSFTKADMPSCGACGLRCFERTSDPYINYRKIRLDEPEATLLRYTEQEKENFITIITNPDNTVTVPVDEHWNTKLVQTWRCQSFFSENEPRNDIMDEQSWNGTTFWHLHPELVALDDDGTPYTMVCPVCDKHLTKNNPERPPLSIAAGVDFGYTERLKALKFPTFHEQMILARSRLFFATMHISSNTYGVVNSNYKNKLKCHAVVFPHDAPEVASYLPGNIVYEKDGILDPDSLKGLLRIILLDDKGNHDKLAEQILQTNTCIARPWVIVQWLTVLKRTHKYYQDIVLGDTGKIVDIIENLNKETFQEREDVSDPREIERTRKIGSDITGNQHVEIFTDAEQRAREEQTSDEEHLPTSYRYVTQSKEAYLAQDREDFRNNQLGTFLELSEQQINRQLETEDSTREQLFNETAMDNYLHRYPINLQSGSIRGSNPDSEYSKDDHAVTTSFPHTFPLGKVYGRPVGRLSTEQRIHLLNQFSLVPSQDRRLLAFLYDVGLRTEVADGVKTYTENNPNSIREIRAFLTDPVKRQELKEALDFPYTESARRLIQHVMKHLRFASKEINYGALEGTKFKHRMLGSTKRYSANTTFLTVSPANLDNPRSLRFTFRTVDNAKFPSVFDTDCDFGNNGTEFMERLSDLPADTDTVITLSKSDRASRAIDNPVAFVMENKQMLHDIMAILLGLPIEDKGFFTRLSATSNRRTRYYRRNKGIFGFPLQCMGVTEGHARGTLHWHFNLNAGLSPQVLQRFSAIPEVCDVITKYLDKTYCSKIPTCLHVQSMLRKTLKKNREKYNIPRDAMNSIQPRGVLSGRAKKFQSIEEGNQGALRWCSIRMEALKQASNQNLHDHQETCRKRPRGLMGCRLDFRQACMASTKPVRLDYKAPVSSSNCNTMGVVNNQENAITDDSNNGNTVTRGDGNNSEETNEGSISGREELSYFSEDDLSCLSEDDNRPEEERTYVVSSLSSYNELRQDQRKHVLKPILQRELRSSVIVWETQRPYINESLFNQDPDDHSNPKEFILNALKNCLSQSEIRIGDETSQFWHWMENEAETDVLRAIYKDIKEKLPLANGYVATFNPALSFCTGSHNNASFLGGFDQSMSALFYLIPYNAKPKFQLEHSLTVFNSAAQHIKRYQSRAVDSGTTKRTAKYFLQRTINKLHCMIELSDWEIAAKLVGMPSMITSDTYAPCDPAALANLNTHMVLEEDQERVLERINNRINDERNLQVTEARRRVQGRRQRLANTSAANYGNFLIEGRNFLYSVPEEVLHNIFEFLCPRSSLTELTLNPSLDVRETLLDLGLEDTDDEEEEGINNEGNNNPEQGETPRERLERMNFERAQRNAKRFRANILPLLLLNKHIKETLMYDEYITEYAYAAYKDIRQYYRKDYDHEAVGSKLGFISKMKVNIGAGSDGTNSERTILIPLDAAFFYRSTDLHNMTYHEYTACISFVKNKKPRKNPTGDMNNMHQQRQFCLDSRFEPHLDSYHVIKMKQNTPLAIGRPPRHPGKKPEGELTESSTNKERSKHRRWKEQANSYARYYLAYFRPVSIHNYRELSYDWEALENYIAFLQTDEDIISKFRLMVMKQHMDGITTSDTCKQMARDYRSRVRDMWPKDVRDKIAQQYSESRKREREKWKQDASFNDTPFTGFTKRTEMCMRAQIRYNEYQERKLREFYNLPSRSSARRSRPRRSQNFMDQMGTRPTHDMQTLVNEMSLWKSCDILMHGPPNGEHEEWPTNFDPSFVVTKIEEIRDRLYDEKRPHHRQQLDFFECLCSDLGYNLTPVGGRTFARLPTDAAFPKVIVVHGSAGVGKTTLRDAILDLYYLLKRYSWKVSFNNANASEMGGKTVASWVGNKSYNRRTIGRIEAGTIQQLRNEGFTSRSLVCVEEFETTAGWHYARLNALAGSAAFDEGTTYGGALTLKFGDMGQLGPVLAGPNVSQIVMNRYLSEDLQKRMPAKKKRKLEDGSVIPEYHARDNEYNANHPDTIATEIFVNAKWYELNEQKRSVDPVHSANVKKLYRGEAFTLWDLKDRDYKVFNQEDACSGEWDEASVLCVTNRERYTITDLRARALARAKGVPVFRWQVNIHSNWENRPPEQYFHDVLEDPCFYQYFVKGCSAFLDEQYMPELNLVKGLTVTYQSMQFKQEDQDIALELIQNAEPGEVITLPFAPLMIIVESKMPRHTPKDIIATMKRFSLCTREDDRTFVFPVMRSECSWTSRPVVVQGGEAFHRNEYGPSKVCLQNILPLQTAFAVTVYKSLGTTLLKVIIALSYNPAAGCNFDYQQLYVALTRVRERSNIRLLLNGNNETEQWKTLMYLQDLRPDPAQAFFFAGFREYDETNPNVNWATDHWCPERANRKFREMLDREQVVL